MWVWVVRGRCLSFLFNGLTQECLLSTTSFFLIQENIHDSRTPVPQSASLILSQGLSPTALPREGVH